MSIGRAIVVQDNELINTPYILTLNEKRLINMVVSKINPHSMPAKGETFEVVLCVHEWRELYGISSKSLYEDIYNACARLADRPALRIQSKQGGKPAIAPWISYAQPEPSDSQIRVKLVYELLLYLKGFVDQFTQYDLANVANLSTFYSIRVYELLCQYKKIGKRVFELDEFRKTVDPQNKYSRWPDLRRFIIERAIGDINRETDLRVSYEQVNPGRKVSKIQFIIKQKRKSKERVALEVV